MRRQTRQTRSRSPSRGSSASHRPGAAGDRARPGADRRRPGPPLTVEVNRNDKYVRVGPSRTRDAADLLVWYYPRDWLRRWRRCWTWSRGRWRWRSGWCWRSACSGAAAVARCARCRHAGTLVVGRARWGSAGDRPRWFFAASWYVATALFDRAPHILDAIAYLFQAKTFAGGVLTATPPLVNEAFLIPFSVLYQERWFVQYPPGTAALLALGVLAGAPWLVQPPLAASAVVLIVLTARRQYGSGTALLVLLLLVTSPFLLLTAGSFLSHVPGSSSRASRCTPHVRYAERPALGWAALAGRASGQASDPRDRRHPVRRGHLARSAWWGVRCGRAIVLDVLVVAAIFGASVGLYLGYNAAVTGDPFLLPRHSSTARMCWDSGRGSASMGSTRSPRAGQRRAAARLARVLPGGLAVWASRWRSCSCRSCGAAGRLGQRVPRADGAVRGRLRGRLLSRHRVRAALPVRGAAGVRDPDGARPDRAGRSCRRLLAAAGGGARWRARQADGADRRGAAGLQRALPCHARRTLYADYSGLPVEDRPWTRR